MFRSEEPKVDASVCYVIETSLSHFEKGILLLIFFSFLFLIKFSRGPSLLNYLNLCMYVC